MWTLQAYLASSSYTETVVALSSCEELVVQSYPCLTVEEGCIAFQPNSWASPWVTRGPCVNRVDRSSWASTISMVLSSHSSNCYLERITNYQLQTSSGTVNIWEGHQPLSYLTNSYALKFSLKNKFWYVTVLGRTKARQLRSHWKILL